MSQRPACLYLVSELVLRKPVLLSTVVFLYTILYTMGNHTFSNSKYIHIKCFKVLKVVCQVEDVEVVLGESFQRLSSVLQYLREMST